MKKLFFSVTIALLCSLFSLSTAVRADAETVTYAVADTRDVWFYAKADEESGLFLLPYTYYVAILERGDTFCKVRYLDDNAPYRSITGYCKTNSLTFVDFTPERPFLHVELTLTYTPETTDFNMGTGAFAKIEKNFVYYGESMQGTTRYYYVSADGVFDYIPAVTEVSFEYNSDYLEKEEIPASASDDTSEPSASPSPLQIAVLCATAAGIIVIVVLMLRGKKPSPHEEPF